MNARNEVERLFIFQRSGRVLDGLLDAMGCTYKLMTHSTACKPYIGTRLFEAGLKWNASFRNLLPVDSIDRSIDHRCLIFLRPCRPAPSTLTPYGNYTTTLMRPYEATSCLWTTAMMISAHLAFPAHLMLHHHHANMTTNMTTPR